MADAATGGGPLTVNGMNIGLFLVYASGVPLNQAGDTIIPVNLPSNVINYRVQAMFLQATSNVGATDATFGLFTAPSQNGLAIVPQIAPTMTATAPNTPGA